jgi:DNA-binding beta-propeller fold protein YncE
MVSGFNCSAWRRYFRSLHVGFVFLLFGGILAHADDIVYVSNPGAGTVSEINSSGNESTFASGLNSPEGVAVDGADNLYVANYGDGTVSQINSAGNVSTYASSFNSPMAVACDPYGNVYVANVGNGTISKINSIGNVSVFASGITFNPDGARLATDNAGNIYAGIYNTIAPGDSQQTVTRFDSNGNQSIAAASGPFTEGFAVDGAGHLYVGHQNANYIFGNGSLLTDSSDYPAPYNASSAVAGFIDPPGDLAFDANGNLYVTFSELVNPNDEFGGLTDALVEFGVNGVNRVVASNIGGLDIAIQSAPEPNTFALTSVVAAFVGFGVRRRKIKSSDHQ